MPNVKFKMKFKQFNFNKNRFLKDYKDSMMKLMIRAARAFALAASSRVPVDTGMARSTFLGSVDTFEGGIEPATTYIGLSDSPTSINVSTNIRRTRKDIDRPEYWKGMFTTITDTYYRTPSEGRERGFFAFSISGSKLTFHFIPKVRHYMYWENRWRSIEQGRKAFNLYIDLNRKKMIPKLNKYYNIKYVGA